MLIKLKQNFGNTNYNLKISYYISKSKNFIELLKRYSVTNKIVLSRIFNCYLNILGFKKKKI
jgi:hypothetical protein